jgi:putative ABC transport system substrate-binding protein
VRWREFITLLGGAVAWPVIARAQQKMPRIGILLLINEEIMGPYRQALRDLGYIEGKSIQFEVRSAQGQTNRLPEVAAELVRSRVDVIVASLTPAVTAARHATSDIPIVMAPAGDPIGSGLISSLARPGGNITGVSGSAPELGAKSLELIREFLPGALRVGYLRNANDPVSGLMLEQAQQGAQTTNFVIHPVMVRAVDDLEGAFAEIARERADAIILSGTIPVQPQINLALRRLAQLHPPQPDVRLSGTSPACAIDWNLLCRVGNGPGIGDLAGYSRHAARRHGNTKFAGVARLWQIEIDLRRC